MTQPQATLGSAAALKRLAEARDSVAWAALLERHGREILHVAYRITRDEALAQDVCQETLLQLRDDARQFQPRSAVHADGEARSWIMRIACNTALKLLRTRQRAQRREEIRRSHSPMQQPQDSDLTEAVRAQLDTLPEKLRLPVYMRFYGGLEYSEMAAELKLSEDAAKKRVSRGLEELRQRLALSGAVLGIAAVSELVSASAAQLPAHLAGDISSLPHLAHWQSLLNSSQTAAIHVAAKTGGLSLMAKCAIAFSSLALVGAVALTASRVWTLEQPAAPAPKESAADGAKKEEKLPVPSALPPSWDRFVILVWQHRTQAPADQALYESVNLKGFHIDGHNDELVKFARTSGWPFYVDHACSKGFLHLKDADVKAMGRSTNIVSRPNSLADPATLEKMKTILKGNIAAAKGSSAVAYAFDDEISPGTFCSPVETDGSTHSVAGYRRHLKDLYGTIEKLNEQYGSHFADFDAIQPQSYEAFREQINADGLGRVNLSQWCDWRSYMDTQFADCLAELTKFANEQDASVPAGFVGGFGPNAFGGQDYRKLTKAVQWMEAYDIGNSDEILRSFWDQKHPHAQTFFCAQNARVNTWYFWHYLCHGDRMVVAWPEISDKQAGSAAWFDKGKVAPPIQALAETFKEVQGPLSKKIIDGQFNNDPVAIYYSHPSIQMTWAMDAAVHKKTWPNRSSSMDNALSTSMLTRQAWLKTLEDIGIQARFIHQDHLLGGALEKQGFKVLLLNRVLCLSDAEADAIKSFARNGGTVIADHLCGIYDEHGKAREQGALDELFGVQHDLSQGVLDGAATTEVDGEKGGLLSEKNWALGAEQFKNCAVFERGLVAQNPAKPIERVKNIPVAVQNGKHTYLNLSPIGYLFKRASKEGANWLSFVSGLLKAGGVEPRVTLLENSQPASLLESIFWNNGNRTTLCIAKNLIRRATIDTMGSIDGMLGNQPEKLSIKFAQPVKNLKNERTGKELGTGTDFEDEFTPWEAGVYTFEK